jgi:hypothetical protein
VISTELTGTGTVVTAAVPLLPPLVAVIVTGPPALAPVTRPELLTLTMLALDVLHVTSLPVSTLPAASLITLASCLAESTNIETDEGSTATLFTDGGAGGGG